MKKTILSILMTGLFIAFTLPSQAQISLGSIKKQAQRSVGKAIEKKVEKELDKAAQSVVNKYWDRVLGKYYQDMYQTGTDEKGDPVYPFKMSSDVKTKEVYSFDHLLKMKMDTYKKNGKLDETVFINTYTNASENYLGTRIESDASNADQQEFFIINDFDTDAMVMLTEENGEKQSIAFSFQLDEEAAEKMNESDDDADVQDYSKFKEIGTKTILGYSCKGYQTEDENNVSEVWISEKPIEGMEKAASMLAKNKKVNVPEGYPEGSLMETTVTDKKTKEKFILKVIEINPNSHLSYKMSEYQNSMTGQ